MQIILCAKEITINKAQSSGIIVLHIYIHILCSQDIRSELNSALINVQGPCNTVYQCESCLQWHTSVWWGTTDPLCLSCAGLMTELKFSLSPEIIFVSYCQGFQLTNVETTNGLLCMALQLKLLLKCTEQCSTIICTNKWICIMIMIVNSLFVVQYKSRLVNSLSIIFM